MVVRTSPEALGTLTTRDAEVTFEFDERISEQVTGGALETAIAISPRSGELRVDRGSRALRVRIEGGFRPGLVYRITLNPVISDLFGNRMSDPFELVFSTGAEPVPTTVAGEVWNRVTGQPVGGATVYAIGADSLVHQATTDQDGIFALRYLPAGQFTVTAFEDLNRDTEIDSAEVQGTGPIVVETGDTLLLDLPILQPDTTPAAVTAATALDSTTVAVRFDDFLDPSVAASSLQVSLGREGGPAPDVVRVLHAGAYQDYVDEVMDSLARVDSVAAEEAAAAAARPGADSAAVRDTVAPDTLAVGDSIPVGDTLAPSDSVPVVDTLVPGDSVPVGDTLAPPDTVRVGRPAAGPPRRGPPRLPPLEGSRAGTTADGRRVLPGRRIVLLLSSPLQPDVEYEVRVAEAVNIVGLGGGGGVTPLVLPPPDTVRADTVRTDTVRVDTVRVDTVTADTARADVAAVLDTGSAPVETHRR